MPKDRKLANNIWCRVRTQPNNFKEIQALTYFLLFCSDCSPVKMWVYSRHGTRLPEGLSFSIDDKTIKSRLFWIIIIKPFNSLAEWIQRLSHLGGVRDEIIDNYEKRHSKPAIGAMCETDLDLLKRWSWDQYVLLLL